MQARKMKIIVLLGLLVIAMGAFGWWWYSPKEQVRRLVRETKDLPGFDSLFDLSMSRSPEKIDKDFLRLGNRAVPELIELLEHPDWRTRQIAAGALGLLKARNAVQPLINALNDPDDLVRQAAAGALGEIGDPAAFEPLISCLNDKSAKVPFVAAEALGLIGDKRAVILLVETLRSGGLSLRAYSATALGVLRDPRSVKPLLCALEDKDRWVRLEAALSLGKMGYSEAVPTLMKEFHNVSTGWIDRRDVAKLLGELRDPRAESVLKKALSGNHPEVQKAAAEALSKLRDSAENLSGDVNH